MKTSFYKKSCRWLVMLVAMFAVSVGAWADEKTVVFQYDDDAIYNNDGAAYSGETKDGVTVSSTGFNEHNDWGPTGIYAGSNASMTINADGEIKSITITNVGYGYGSYYANNWSFTNVESYEGAGSNTLTITPTAGSTQVVINFIWSGSNIKCMTVVYEEQTITDPINYTVNFTGTVPEGCSASYGEDTFTSNGNFEVAKNLTKEDLLINSTADYYADVDYDATNHTYTVEFKHWYTYNFVVSIPTYNPNAAVYGGDRYYENGESRLTKTALEESTFVAYDLNGYDENVAVTGSDYTYTVTATYTESAPIEYTIIIPEEPAGISVTVNDAIYYNVPGTYHYLTPLTLAANRFVVTAPSGYYADNAYSCYNEETHTFTANVIEYLHYNVVVEGTTDANAGVVFNYTTYHNGETIDTDYELYASYVTPANVAGLVGEVALNDKTFTVTYKVPEYFTVDFTQQTTYNDGEISVTTSAGIGSYGINIYSGNTLTVETTNKAIAKIVFNGLRPYYSTGSSAVAVNEGSGSWLNGNNSSSPATWNAADDCYKAVFTNQSGADFYIGSIYIYLVSPEPVDAPEFPLEGVAYEIKNVDKGTFLNLVNSESTAVTLNSSKEEIYFTWDEMKAGFTITDADGNCMGKSSNEWNISSTTPEYWTVESIGDGKYVFHCSQGYLGFNSSQNPNTGYRNIQDYNNDHCTFTITPILKGNELGVDTDGNYWTTFSNVKPTLLPEEYTPYIVTGADETLTLVAIEDHIVPANTGVLVMSEEPAVDGVAYEVLTANTTSTTNVSENLLRAGDGTYWENESNYYYMFSLNGTDDEGSVGFYWAIEGGHGVMTKLNKAYLVLDGTANVRGFRLDGKADATEGIFNALNGQEEAGAMFNLNGQRVNGKPAAGVYVKNGRKLIVK